MLQQDGASLDSLFLGWIFLIIIIFIKYEHSSTGV